MSSENPRRDKPADGLDVIIFLYLEIPLNAESDYEPQFEWLRHTYKNNYYSKIDAENLISLISNMGKRLGLLETSAAETMTTGHWSIAPTGITGLSLYHVNTAQSLSLTGISPLAFLEPSMFPQEPLDI